MAARLAGHGAAWDKTSQRVRIPSEIVMRANVDKVFKALASPTQQEPRKSLIAGAVSGMLTIPCVSAPVLERVPPFFPPEATPAWLAATRPAVRSAGGVGAIGSTAGSAAYAKSAPRSVSSDDYCAFKSSDRSDCVTSPCASPAELASSPSTRSITRGPRPQY